MGGLPAEPLPGQLAGGRLVQGEYCPEKTEILRGDRCGGEIEPAADDLGERTHRITLVGDGVRHRAGLRPLEGQAEQPGGVEDVHGRPALTAVADVTGDPRAPSGLDQQGRESARAGGPVHGSREADHRRADVLGGQP